MNAGESRIINRSVRASITFVEFSFRSTLMAKHFRLNSSRMFNVRKTFPEPGNLAMNLFSGLGGKHSVAHNHIIDFALNYVIIIVILVLGVLVFMCTKLWKEVLGCLQSKICFPSLLAIFITNNMFNSAATQLLFMAHFLFALMFVWPLKKNVLGQPKEL